MSKYDVERVLYKVTNVKGITLKPPVLHISAEAIVGIKIWGMIDFLIQKKEILRWVRTK